MKAFQQVVSVIDDWGNTRWLSVGTTRHGEELGTVRLAYIDDNKLRKIRSYRDERTGDIMCGINRSEE